MVLQESDYTVLRWLQLHLARESHQLTPNLICYWFVFCYQYLVERIHSKGSHFGIISNESRRVSGLLSDDYNVVLHMKRKWIRAWVLLRKKPSTPLFFEVLLSGVPNHWLPTNHHVHIYLLSLQLSCNETCQIWTWFTESQSKIENCLSEKFTNDI